MRNLIFYGCIVLATGVGLIVGFLHGGWGMAIYCGLQFAAVGLALGGLLTFFGRKPVDRKRAKRNHWQKEDREHLPNPVRDGSGTSPEEIAENFWRDKGHPPFTNPEYLDDFRRSEDLFRHVSGDKGLPPMMDPDDPDPGR